MGINRFFQLLKKFNTNIDDISYDVSLSSLKGCKIAIDATNISYVLMYKSQKSVVKNTNFMLQDIDREEVIKNWINIWKNLIRNLLSNDIIPICVFDNKSSLMKLDKQKERRAIKIENIKKINELRDFLYKNDSSSSSSPYESIQNIDKLEEYQKLVKNQIYIKSSDMENIKTMLENIGIPVISSPENIEAEFYCSWLTIEGYTIATYSSDTDCYACGCPLIITDIRDSYRDQTVKMISINNILQLLQLTYREFLDMCILAGTDFNKNISKIGIIKSYNYIKKYKTIENIINNVNINNEDIENLNYQTLRSMYLFQETKINISDLMLKETKDPNWFDIVDNVSKNFLNYDINRIPDAVHFKL